MACVPTFVGLHFKKTFTTLLWKKTHNTTKELFVIVEKCDSKTRVVVPSASYKIGGLVWGNEKEENKKRKKD
jgi:hypothetical protein